MTCSRLVAQAFIKPPKTHQQGELLLYGGDRPKGRAGHSGTDWAGARWWRHGLAGDYNRHSAGVVGLISNVHGTLWIEVEGSRGFVCSIGKLFVEMWCGLTLKLSKGFCLEGVCDTSCVMQCLCAIALLGPIPG